MKGNQTHNMPRLILYFLALISLSTAPNWSKLNQMPAEVLGFWRLAFAAGLLLFYQKFIKKSSFSISSDSLKWTIASGFFLFLHLWTYKFAAKHTLISMTMILFATNPIWTAILNTYVFKQKINRRMTISFSIAFFAIFLLTGNPLSSHNINNWGNISALASALLYAVFLITSKKARLKVSNLQFASLQYSTCACFFLLASLIAKSDLIAGYTQISWFAVLGLVAFPTLLGHFLFTYLMDKMNLTVMTCGKLIEPVLASFIAYFLFQEQLSAATYLAFALTSFAILNLFWPQIKNLAR